LFDHPKQLSPAITRFGDVRLDRIPITIIRNDLPLGFRFAAEFLISLRPLLVPGAGQKIENAVPLCESLVTLIEPHYPKAGDCLVRPLEKLPDDVAADMRELYLISKPWRNLLLALW
jgi:hypothetical protein